ncbi:type II toxin-antitoxin system RelE/ParE family toxin [Erythrobacter donghaensis]|uniref:type II toxin-antitoxin system RelE/ParE family toxin n=1 Tax=Erythrobacter donghaensis TaxID=267135 RepID=UPI000A3677E3|nr:type II toxin-antitoxin system RelE/ParE family toxin [Erythrobacter donghaensis]
MIRSFACKETERIWIGRASRKLPADIQQRALAKLALLNRVKTIDDLRNPPSNRLHALTGDREGQHSVSINMQWRICFVFENGDAHGVEIVDYH